MGLNKWYLYPYVRFLIVYGYWNIIIMTIVNVVRAVYYQMSSSFTSVSSYLSMGVSDRVWRCWRYWISILCVQFTCVYNSYFWLNHNTECAAGNHKMGHSLGAVLFEICRSYAESIVLDYGYLMNSLHGDAHRVSKPVQRYPCE